MTDHSIRYEYCVNEAKYCPKPELNSELRSAETVEASVFAPPRRAIYTLKHSEGRPELTFAPADTDWEYMRHDVVATNDDVCVMVTWRRPKRMEEP